MKSLLRVVLVVMVILVLLVAAAGGYAWHRIAQLKTDLALALGAKLQAQVEISSFEVDPWQQEIHASGVTMQNENSTAPWISAQINQAQAHFQWSDLFAESLLLSVEVSGWNLVLKSEALSPVSLPGSTSVSSAGSSAPAPAEPGAKSRFQVAHLAATQGQVTVQLSGNKKIVLNEIALQADQASSGLWTTHLTAKNVLADAFQGTALEATLHSDADHFNLDAFQLACGAGQVTGTGKLTLNPNPKLELKMEAKLIPVAMLVSAPWQVKLSGWATGDLTYVSENQSAQAHGHVEIAQGKFNLFPQLSTFTTMLGMPDLSTTELDQASTDYVWHNGLLQLSKIVLTKNEVAKIIGDAQLDATEQVDGKLKLGLPAALIDKWPKLKEKVFTVNLENYDWTEVHVTGTPDHLQEDLSPRVMAVGTSEAGTVMNQVLQKGSDYLKSFFPASTPPPTPNTPPPLPGTPSTNTPTVPSTP